MQFLESSYNQSGFNRLPEIEIADAVMRERDSLSVALAELGPIFTKYRVCDAWGISLLHKHWPLEQGEGPVQELVRKNSEMQFVTKPKVLQMNGPHLPSILGVTADARLYAVEFSTDPQVSAAHDVLRNTPGFVVEFCRAIVAKDLRETFGLIANKQLEEDQELVEFNYTGRISVLRLSRSDDPSDGRYIQTSWRFVADSSGIDCHFRYLSTCESGVGEHQPKHPPDHGIDT